MEHSDLMRVMLRAERPCDIPAIEQVTREAFLSEAHSSHTEQYIVNALREAGALTLSLVAEDAGVVIGHASISPVTFSTGEPDWYGLAPVSVIPARQGQGIGSQLIQQMLKQLRERGAAGCVVLGEPGYYSRFGFKAGQGPVLAGVPPEYFQALAFSGAYPSGEVRFHGGFDAQG